MRAAAVAARDKRRLRLGDLAERRNGIMPAGDMRRIGGGSDDDKIVPGDLPVPRAMPLRDELLLGVGVMHEDEIGVAAPRRVERLSGALRQHMHVNPGLPREDREDRAEEPGIVERGRRRQQDGVGRHLGRARIRQP